MRTPVEIQDEIAKWVSFVRARRVTVDAVRDKGALAAPRERIEGESASIEAAAASIIVNALTWALNETPSPTIHVRIR